MKLVLVCLMLLAGPLMAHAANTYYLNPASGLDSNNGLSATGTAPNGPWKTMAKVKTSVTAGDIVNVIGGTYTATQYKGETGTPLWTHAHGLGSANNPITIQARPGDTVIFDGEYTTYWMLFRAAAAYGGHYVVVKNLTFQHYAGVAVGVGVNGVVQSHHVAVLNCTFQNFTSNQSGAAGSNTADQVIYRGNRFINIGDPTLGGDGIPDSQHALYISHDSHHIVIDQNYMEQISGFGVHGYGGWVAGSTSGNWIIRNNTIVNTWSSSQTYTGDTFSNIYIYNNTMYNQQVPWAALGPNSANSFITTHGGGTYTNIVIKNNIGYGYAVQGMVWVDNSALLPTLSLNYNLWQNLLNTNKIYRWNSTDYSIAAFRTAFPAYEAQRLQSTPTFVSIDSRNFQLAPGSPGINAGTPLTTATNSGTNSTALTVGDTNYFTDGFGLVPGDTIQLGTQTAVIASINSATSLTLTTARTWTSGQAVSLPFAGSAPDMGAFETAPAATQLRFTTQPRSTPVGRTLPPLVVQVLDASNALVPDATNTVTLTVSAGPGFLPGTSAGVTQLFAAPKTGRFVKLITLADANGSHSASAAEITVLNAGTLIPQSDMSVVSVSSQETATCCGGPHLATQALDGNPSTYWYTQYTGGKLGPPYTLVLDLGAPYVVNGWTYLPHQLSDLDGHVTQYEFYVSTDGTTWGTALTNPLLTGTVSHAAVGGGGHLPGPQFWAPGHGLYTDRHGLRTHE